MSFPISLGIDVSKYTQAPAVSVFPWGMYLSGQEWTTTAEFDSLTDTLLGLGCTHLVMGSGGATPHTEEVALCDTKGLGLFFIVSADFTAGTSAADIVTQWSGHPSIRYWSARDEPSSSDQIVTDIPRVQDLQRLSHKPAGDTFGVYTGGNVPAQQDLAQQLQPGILVLDNYPLTLGNAAGNLTRNGFSTDFAATQRLMVIDAATGVEWREPNIPWWSILQGHGSPSLRAPSLAEMTRMTWEAVGTGSNGIYWFIWAYTDANQFVFDGISTHPDRQATLHALSARLQPLAAYFTSTRRQVAPTYATGAGVAYALRSSRGEDLLVVVNRSVGSSQAISLASGGPYTDLETDEVVTAGTSFTLAPGDARFFHYEQPDLTVGKLVWDTFTAADNTPLIAHTPEVGGPWTDLLGTSGILRGQATNLVGGDTLAVVDPGSTNVTISADLAYPGAGQSHLCLRARDSNNHVRGGFVDNKLGLVKKIGGTVTILFHDATVRNTGEMQRIELSQSGNTFKLYRNGVLLTTQTVTELASETKAGVFFTSTLNARVDNLAIVANS